ncbi:MAG: OmpA family protein [Alphaproteobacteria bacterium]|nr:OmpA family protein [Alphaproteobacteria bacterium]
MKRSVLVGLATLAVASTAIAADPPPGGPDAKASDAAAPAAVPSSAPKKYPDGRGGVVEFPLGDISFADEVVSFQVGAPRAAEPNSQPGAALGVPNYVETADDTYVTLGCAGVLTLRFADNALTDGAGADLFVFEIGPLVEKMNLAISPDGAAWIDVGVISGGRAAVDIAGHVKPGDVFHFVRLTDGRARCDGQWPGADVDAVGAIGAALQFSLNSEVLFDTGRSDLKPAARAELDKVASKIGSYDKGRVTIEGHTDDVGATAANLTLSQNRALSVQRYLQAKAELSAFTFATHGYGEGRPVASNAGAEGRARNRRVDVVLQPGGD